MIRALTVSLLLATSCFAAENAAAEAKPETKTEQPKSSGFKMPSMAEMSSLAGNYAQKFDSKLSLLEQGVAAIKPSVDALAQPANAKILEKYTLLTQSLPKVRSAVDALKSGKTSNPKAEVNSIQENLKNAESLFSQVKSMLPAPAPVSTPSPAPAPSSQPTTGSQK